MRTAGAFCCGALSVAGAGLLTAASLAFTDEGFLQAARLLFLAHVPVMIVEGIVTALAVSFLSRVRPELCVLHQAPKEAPVRSLFTLLVFVLLTPGPALAHRVNVFAYVEGGEIVVECSYSKSKKVGTALSRSWTRPAGKPCCRATTDEQGLFRFPVPEEARSSGSGLRILLQAGEGHQNEWIVDAAEFMGETSSAARSHPVSKSGPACPGAWRTKPGQQSGLTRSDVEEVVAAALDAKLAPIKRELLEQSQKGPGMQEIVGGIGWIFGLIGVAAYFKSRPRV
jgi:nickel transport protein